MPLPLLLCARAAVEPKAVVSAKIPAITKAFFIVVSSVAANEACRSKETRHAAIRFIAGDQINISGCSPAAQGEQYVYAAAKIRRIKVGEFNNEIVRRRVFANRGECHRVSSIHFTSFSHLAFTMSLRGCTRFWVTPFGGNNDDGSNIRPGIL